MSCAVVLLSSLLAVPEVVWQPVDGGTSGVPAEYAAAAYDTARQRLIVFRNDVETWEFSVPSKSWSNRTPTPRLPTTNPQSRMWPSLTFAAGLNVTLLFGGRLTTGLKDQADLWQWDGARWTEQRTSFPTPHPRIQAGFAYDDSRQRAVLVGGGIELPAGGAMDPSYQRAQKTTWEWDGQRWWSYPDSGAPTGYVQLLYDAAEKRVLLYAHHEEAGSIWRWDGAAKQWIEIGNVAVVFSDRRFPAVTYDAGRRRLVLFGGEYNQTAPLDLLYDWDPALPTVANFIEKRGAWPIARETAFLFHDPRAENLVLYGGRRRQGSGNPPMYTMYSDVWTMHFGNVPEGASCSATTASRCASQNCVDGSCCLPSSCKPCQSCGLRGSEGRCTDLPDGTSDPDSCAAPRVCDGAGRCRDPGGMSPGLDGGGTPTDARPAPADGAGGGGAGAGGTGGGGGSGGAVGSSDPDAAIAPEGQDAGSGEETRGSGDGGARGRRRLYAGAACAVTPRGAGTWPGLVAVALAGLWLVLRSDRRGPRATPRDPG